MVRSWGRRLHLVACCLPGSLSWHKLTMSSGKILLDIPVSSQFHPVPRFNFRSWFIRFMYCLCGFHMVPCSNCSRFNSFNFYLWNASRCSISPKRCIRSPTSWTRTSPAPSPVFSEASPMLFDMKTYDHLGARHIWAITWRCGITLLLISR